MDINNILAFGLPAIAVVIGLVEISKKLGASGNLCTIMAVVYGVVIMLLVQLSVAFPMIEPWVRTVLYGVVVGLAAAGVYDYTKKFIPPQS